MTTETAGNCSRRRGLKKIVPNKVTGGTTSTKARREKVRTTCLIIERVIVSARQVRYDAYVARKNRRKFMGMKRFSVSDPTFSDGAVVDFVPCRSSRNNLGETVFKHPISSVCDKTQNTEQQSASKIKMRFSLLWHQVKRLSFTSQRNLRPYQLEFTCKLMLKTSFATVPYDMFIIHMRI